MDYQGFACAIQFDHLDHPTVAQRNAILTGISTSGRTIYNPSRWSPARQHAGAPRSQNTIPPLRPISMVPLPQTSGATQNYTFNPTAMQRTDQFDVRGDQNLDKADRLFFKYSYISTDSLSPGTVPSVPTSGIPVGPYIAGGATNTSFRNWSATLIYTMISLIL